MKHLTSYQRKKKILNELPNIDTKVFHSICLKLENNESVDSIVANLDGVDNTEKLRKATKLVESIKNKTYKGYNSFIIDQYKF